MLKETQKILQSLKKENGFTLVELLVSAGILTIVVAGMMISYIRCMELNEVSQNKSMATKAARSRMELIRMTSFDNLVTTYHGVAFDVTGLSGKGVSYVTSLDAKNIQVRISVSWRQKNGRVYGEDKNLNGVINAGEDTNANGVLNSPVEIVSTIFKRD